MEVGANGFPGSISDIWEQDQIQPKYPPISEDITADIVIVGAGISGLSIAYNLAKAGKDVVVLEKTVRGGGQTGRTTAQLQRWNDNYYHAIEQKYGIKDATRLGEAHMKSIEWVGNLVEQENIDCDFKWTDGYLHPDSDSKEAKEKIQKELDTCKRMGWDDVKMTDLGGGQDVGMVGEALHFPKSARFHPVKYVDGLAEAAVRAGAKIYEQTGVTKPAQGKTLETTTGYKVTGTGAIVLATMSPINHNLALHSRQEAVRLYVVCFKLPKGGVQDKLYWDTASPYHSIRLQEYKGDDVLIVRAENHVAGIRPSEYVDARANIEHLVQKRFPQAKEVLFSWSGQIYKPTDQLHLFGRNPLFDKFVGEVPHYVATGDSGQGMTGGTIAGLTLSEQILKKDKPIWGDLFNPERVGPLLKSLKEEASVIEMVTQGYGDAVAATKKTDIKGVISPSEVEKDLKPGTGIVVQQGGPGPNKVAMFKTDGGEVRKFSAICPHLKCAVEWNPNAKTFDCPCHGSQFDDEGQCIQGPAVQDLSPMK